MAAPAFAVRFFYRLLHPENIGVKLLTVCKVWGIRCFWVLTAPISLFPAVTTAVQSAPADYLVSLVRHGDRSPRELGAQAELWPVGPGQLTALGATQMITLGREIRQHYFGSSLPEQWSLHLSHHFAKGTYRTMQSASALLQGMFPASANKTGLPGNIQLPPVFSSPVEKDFLFSSQHICPGYVCFIKKLEQSSRWLEKKKKYGDRFEYWRKLAGVERGIYPLAGFMDRVAIHSIHKLPMPVGITPEDAGALSELLDWLLASLAREQRVAQLVTAPLVSNIINNFQQTARCLNGKGNPGGGCSKWILYLGSDINMLALLALLGTPQDKNVRYGAHLAMKLNWDEINPQISLFLNHAPLYVPGCGTSCHLDTWLEVLDRILPDSWESLCNISSDPKLNDSDLAHPLPDGKKL